MKINYKVAKRLHKKHSSLTKKIVDVYLFTKGKTKYEIDRYDLLRLREVTGTMLQYLIDSLIQDDEKVFRNYALWHQKVFNKFNKFYRIMYELIDSAEKLFLEDMPNLHYLFIAEYMAYAKSELKRYNFDPKVPTGKVLRIKSLEELQIELDKLKENVES